MQQIEQQFATALESIDDPAEMIETFFDGVQQRPSYPRLLSSLLLEGIDPADHIDDFPAVTRLRETIAQHTNSAEAPFRTQCLLAFVAGWSTMHGFMADAAGLEPNHRARDGEWARRQAVSIALDPTTT